MRPTIYHCSLGYIGSLLDFIIIRSSFIAPLSLLTIGIMMSLLCISVCYIVLQLISFQVELTIDNIFKQFQSRAAPSCSLRV